MYAANPSRDLTVHKRKMSTTTSINGGEEKDIISELPDPILHCILSSLDMTTVFQTCFLSKRWRYFWTTLPFLNFSNEVYDSCSTFSKINMMFFVDRVLILRNQNSTIQSFRFSHTRVNLNIVNHISTWIQILIRSNVQEIDIHLISSKLDSFKLPMSLFTCTSLTTLKLGFSTGRFIDDCPRFELPVEASMICLPSLKTLHLTSLLLLEYSIELLISSSPVLETLIMNKCLLDTQELIICNPQIKSLVIERMLRAESNTDHESCKIKVFAPKLTSFSITDYIGYINSYSFVNISSFLVKADIDMVQSNYYMNEDEIDIDSSLTRKNAIDFLRGICNVRSLMLSAWFIEQVIVIQFPEPFESLQINPFCNLSFLTLKTLFSKYQIYAIMYLLEKCPNLEHLVLKTNESLHRGSKWERDEGWEAESAPQCIMHHLRLVEIWDVVTSVNELEFLKFLLKNAIVLEKMIVITSKEQLDYDNTKRFSGFNKELKSFRGASTSSEIFFKNILVAQSIKHNAEKTNKQSVK